MSRESSGAWCRVTTAVVVTLVCVSVLLAGCGKKKNNAAPENLGDESGQSTSSLVDGDGSTTSLSTTTTTEPPATPLVEGVNYVFLRKIDTTNNTATVDLLEYLQDEKALQGIANDGVIPNIAAAVKSAAGTFVDPAGPGVNDFLVYARNVNPALRTISIDPKIKMPWALDDFDAAGSTVSTKGTADLGEIAKAVNASVGEIAEPATGLKLNPISVETGTMFEAKVENGKITDLKIWQDAERHRGLVIRNLWLTENTAIAEKFLAAPLADGRYYVNRVELQGSGSSRSLAFREVQYHSLEFDGDTIVTANVKIERSISKDCKFDISIIGQPVNLITADQFAKQLKDGYVDASGQTIGPFEEYELTFASNKIVRMSNVKYS